MKVILYILWASLLVSCTFKKEEKCFEANSIAKELTISENYKIDSIGFRDKKVEISIAVVDPDLLEFQAERESLFYGLKRYRLAV